MTISPARLLWQVAIVFLLVFSGSMHAAEYEAQLEWPHTSVVTFAVDGGVIAVHVRAGDPVSKGMKLVELNPDPAAFKLSELRATLAALQPALADAGREHEHALSLYEQTVISDVELEKTRLALDKASAQVAAAQARLDLARWRLARKTVYAPWNGIVLRSEIKPGDMLVAEQRSKRWMELAKTDSIAARAVVPASQAASLAPGTDCRVSVAGQSWAAKIIELTPAKMPGHYSVLAEFAMPKQTLSPEVRLLAGQPATLITAE